MIRCRQRKAHERSSTPLRQCHVQYTATRVAHRLSEITFVVFLSLARPILFVAICGANRALCMWQDVLTGIIHVPGNTAGLTAESGNEELQKIAQISVHHCTFHIS